MDTTHQPGSGAGAPRMPEHDPVAASEPSKVALLEVELVNGKCAATRCRAGYPLKLLIPPTLASFAVGSRHGAPAPGSGGGGAGAAAGSGRPEPIWAFLVGFGGGLVAGDLMALTCSVGPGATAVLTTQATTKARGAGVALHSPEPNITQLRWPSAQLASAALRLLKRHTPHPALPQVYHARGRSTETTGFRSSGPSAQPDALARALRPPADRDPALFSMAATVADGGLLAVVPGSVACFEDSRYRQAQRVALAPRASFACLDWITSGRAARGEVWSLSLYSSALQVTRISEATGEPEPLLTEALLLQPSPGLSVAERMGRAHVYGTLVLTGPRVSAAADALLADLVQFTRGCFQRSRNDPAEPFFFASGSPIAGGCVVRFAAESGEAAAAWVRAALSPVEAELGGSPFLL